MLRCRSVHIDNSLELRVCVSGTKDALAAEIMVEDYIYALFSAVH